MEFEFQQSCVIPYRLTDGKCELLLITSLRKKNWIFPKGFVEFNLSPFESAKKEAYEEAGVIGSNETIELGTYVMNKKAGRTLIRVYSMEVIEELKDYPEKNLRKRKWFVHDDAVKKIESEDLKSHISKLVGILKT